MPGDDVRQEPWYVDADKREFLNDRLTDIGVAPTLYC
jgi:hypothetical protein